MSFYEEIITIFFYFQVNGVIVSGLSHSKVVDILRKAEGSVQLTICRDILPLTYSEAPTPPNMSAQTEAILAEQPAPAPSPETCSSPDVIVNKPVDRPPGMTFDNHHVIADFFDFCPRLLCHSSSFFTFLTAK